ncbi:ABC transporter permease [Carbonactinospora thermoautotrophica]|uniref:ABC transporter permease n=1 Tax=Carbonactinospora thermoautotrophica TaxID=1469144 RepID=UPI0008327BF9|nr:iron export ABC transporter permease subunit FetB [Carbonactinospora thermoautotrophica]
MTGPLTASPAGVNALSWGGVALTLLLVAVAIAVAARQRLGLTRELVTAAARAAIQLAAVGAVLGVLFRYAGVPGSLAWVAFMVAVAGQVAGRRGRGLPHARMAATVAVAAATATVLGALLGLGVLSAEPRVMVPIGGMLVSGAMQAASLALLRLRESATAARPAIEARLCLGLPAAAFAPYRRGALRTALIPAVDATKVVGLISLPGAMTGLILAGTDPLTAIRYQIVVMYMLLAANTLAALVAAWLAERTLFDHAHRLRPLPAEGTSP